MKQEPVKTNNPHVENKSSRMKIYLFIVIIFVILIPVVYFLWVYMTHGKLSGNVYVSMKSGDSKKAAGIEILLLKVDDADSFKEEIVKANLEALGSIAPLLDQSTEIKKMVDSYYSWYKFYSEEIDKIDSYSFQITEYAKNKKKEFNENKEKEWDSYSQESKKYEDIIGKIKTIRGDYNAKVLNLFSPKVINKAQTDVNGFYQFSRIKHGKYLVYAHFKVFDENIDWLFPVEVNQAEINLDLTNSNVNAFRIFYDL